MKVDLPFRTPVVRQYVAYGTGGRRADTGRAAISRGYVSL